MNIRLVLRRHPHLCEDVARLAREGPWQFPRSEERPSAADELLYVDLVRLAFFGGDALAAFGDSHGAARLIQPGFLLVSRLQQIRGGAVHYLMMSALAGMAMAVSDALADRSLSEADCHILLDALPPAQGLCPVLVDAIRTEFTVGLRSLADDPRVGDSDSDGAVAGNFNAMETERLVAESAREAISNARRPWSQYAEPVAARLAQDAKAISLDVDSGTYEHYHTVGVDDGLVNFLDRIRPSRQFTSRPEPLSMSMRARFNRVPNGLGRLDAGISFYRMYIREGCQCRADQDLIRILLASRIYRYWHDGSLPATEAGFVPILGAWPLNPFDGKPFRYDAKREIAYGVGEDLKDHGGDVDVDRTGKDLGISLKLVG